MSQGFSLVEFLVVVVVISILSAGSLAMLHQGQLTYQAQEQRVRSVEEARIAMDVIVRYLRQSGNDPERFMETNNIPAIEQIGTNTWRLRSDLTGSVASAGPDPRESTGDPNGALDSFHEDVVIGLRGSDLILDLGLGEAILAENISVFQLTFFDRWARAVSNPERALRVKVEVITVDNLSLVSDVFLKRSTYYQLFGN